MANTTNTGAETKTPSHKEITLSALGPAWRADMNEMDLGLLDMAADIDRLRASVVRDSLYMAEKFTEYATGIAKFGSSGSSPMGYSTLRDVERNSAKFEVLLDSFGSFFYSRFNKSIADARKVMS